MNADDFLQRLDETDDEDYVRKRLAGGGYNAQHKKLAEEWLRKREQLRQDAQRARVDAREEENLEISRKALTNSVTATRAAYIALIVSVIVAAIEVIRWLIARGT
jgi:hypothetical protein